MTASTDKRRLAYSVGRPVRTCYSLLMDGKVYPYFKGDGA